MSSIVKDEQISSIEYLNNGLNLIVGFNSGSIHLYDTKTLKLLSMVKNAHLEKNDEGVNCLKLLESTDADSTDKNPVGQLPFFISGGADSMLKIYEHNPYMPEHENAPAATELKKFQSLKAEFLDEAAFNKATLDEKKNMLKEALKKSNVIEDQVGKDSSVKVIEMLVDTEKVEDAEAHLKKLADFSDSNEYLNE